MRKVDPDGAQASELSESIAYEATAIAAEACSVHPYELTARGRSRADVAFARQLAIYLCHVVGQLPMGEISAVYRRDRTTIAHACRAMEDRRETPLFDSQIEMLEEVLRERLEVMRAERTRLPVNLSAWRKRKVFPRG